MNKLIHQNTNILFSKTDQAPTDYAPVSENCWHTHTGIQILIVTDGTGCYQEKGKPTQMLAKGEVVFILPNIEHWHAASHESEFTNVTISGQTRNEIVTWLQKTIKG